MIVSRRFILFVSLAIIAVATAVEESAPEGSGDSIVSGNEATKPTIQTEQKHLTEAEKEAIENNETCDIERTLNDALMDYLLCGTSIITKISLNNNNVGNVCVDEIKSPQGSDTSYVGHAATFYYPPGTLSPPMLTIGQNVRIQYIYSHDLGLEPENFTEPMGNSAEVVRTFTFLGTFESELGEEVERYVRFRTKVIWMYIKCFSYRLGVKGRYQVWSGREQFALNVTAQYLLYVIMDDVVNPKGSFAIAFSTMDRLHANVLGKYSCKSRGIGDDFGGLLQCPDADKFRQILHNLPTSHVK